MEIRVIYSLDADGLINACDLEYMIKSRKIIAFERQGKWVMVDKGPIREKPQEPIPMDRRQVAQHI
jgi:hypothetical protein